MQAAARARARSEPWTEGSDPCLDAEKVLFAWDYELRKFHDRYNEYPSVLSRQVEGFYGFWKFYPFYLIPDVEIDPWGLPYSYTRIPSGYILFSNGPDRVPNTNDDVYPRDPADKCRLSLMEVGEDAASAPSGMSSRCLYRTTSQ